MVNFKVMENIISKMVIFIKDNSKKTSFMARENISNQMENNFIKVSFRTTRKMVMEFIIMLIVLYMKVNGKMI